MERVSTSTSTSPAGVLTSSVFSVAQAGVITPVHGKLRQATGGYVRVRARWKIQDGAELREGRNRGKLFNAGSQSLDAVPTSKDCCSSFMGGPNRRCEMQSIWPARVCVCVCVCVLYFTSGLPGYQGLQVYQDLTYFSSCCGNITMHISLNCCTNNQSRNWGEHKMTSNLLLHVVY